MIVSELSPWRGTVEEGDRMIKQISLDNDSAELQLLLQSRAFRIHVYGIIMPFIIFIIIIIEKQYK